MKYITAFYISLVFLINSATAQDADEIKFVTEFFDKLQPISIAQKREYCGYFGLNDNDEYIATEPTKGKEDSCYADEPPIDMNIFASYHTHGAYHIEADSELPSSADLEADIYEEVDGYISTPGGRIWFTDSYKEITIMICGRNCTVSDDRYEDGSFAPTLTQYNMEKLLERDEMMD